MSVSAVNKKNTLNSCTRSHLQSGYDVIAQMAKTIQTFAVSVIKALSSSIILDVVSFLAAGTLSLSYATSFPLVKSLILFSRAVFIGISPIIISNYICAQFFQKQKEKKV